MNAPVKCFWDGEVLKPIERQRWLADRNFVVGEIYPMVVHEERSHNSHNHFFAALNEAWQQLPEDLAPQFPTAEHLRKRALIDGGFYDELAVDAGSDAAALRVMRAFKQVDDFALVFTRGPIVIRRTAKSQSARAMGKDDFQRSKQAVLEIVSAMIGVKPEELTKQTNRTPRGGTPPVRRHEAPLAVSDAAASGNLNREDA